MTPSARHVDLANLNSRDVDVTAAITVSVYRPA